MKILPHRMPLPSAGVGRANPAEPSAFVRRIRDAVKQVNDLQLEAETKTAELATDPKAPVHETMVALERADLSFRFLTRARSRALEAYQEVMRMPV